VICATLLFIHAVPKNACSSLVSTTILKHHAFLETFTDLCFSDASGLLRDTRVPRVLVTDIQRSLFSLNKALAAHREAWRYVGVASKAKRQQTYHNTSTSMSNNPRTQWRDEMKERSQVWKERASPGVHAALFDNEEMKALVLACSTSVDRIRHTLTIVLLGAGERSAHLITVVHAAQLDITHILERQRRRSSRPPEHYTPLTGRLTKSFGTLHPDTSFMKTIYSKDCDEVDVIVEVRPYSDTPAWSMWHLAWFLSQSDHIASKPNRSTYTYNMLTLDCMGYIDDPANARSSILYRSPQSHPWAADPPSLHDTIMQGWSAKISLDQRFTAARILAASVLDIHSSGHLHRNINSQTIAMLPRYLDDPEPSPYLLGWGHEGRRSAEPLSLKANIYRHRTQFGQGSVPSTTEQDIYSLGIVLLEIGLWTTMSTVFAKLLETTPLFIASEENAMFEKVNRVILDLAGSPDVRREMGESYALVVQKCLNWSHNDAAQSMLRFRKEVVDALDDGRRL
jgi:hypothetical protein